MSRSRPRTQSLPFSTGAIRSSGNRRAQAVADQRGDRVDDGPAAVADDGREARAALERRHLAVADALPLVDVALVAAVGGVHADQDVGLCDQLPERVELGEGERARAHAARHRSRAG